jgi:hypothetical protein
MSFDIGPLPGVQPGAAPRRAKRAPAGTGFSPGLASAARPGDRADVSISASTPPDVRAEVAAAAQRAADLWADDRELNFRKDDVGRIVIEVRDRAGNVIRTIPPSAALAVMAGAGL